MALLPLWPETALRGVIKLGRCASYRLSASFTYGRGADIVSGFGFGTRLAILPIGREDRTSKVGWGNWAAAGLWPEGLDLPLPPPLKNCLKP
jgi:hypothetical protein